MQAAAARVTPDALSGFAARLLQAAGATPANADCVAGALVAADHQGSASHGVMLLPMYLERVMAGSVDPVGQGRIVSDQAGATVLDAENAFGQVSSERAVRLAVERARVHALAAVAVRNGFHFGAAGRWTDMMAKEGCIGIALSNTRPLMPAPGGASRVVGNNPIGFSSPAGQGGERLTVDMALSAAAMGKIRLAEAANASIPPDWATDATGAPTTDPAVAIKGMLLPAGGAKGFGLALMAEILAGGLSGGAMGDEVSGLYGDPAVPYRCSHLFLAIDIAAFRPQPAFAAAASALLATIRASSSAAGQPPVRVPGDAAAARRAAAATISLPAGTVQSLDRWAERLGCTDLAQTFSGVPNHAQATDHQQ